MNQELLLNLVLLGGLMGFGLFGVIHALSVWRSRNRSSGKSSESAPRLGRRIKWLGWGLLLASAITLMGAVVWSAFVPREGLLSGDELFAVRAREGWTVDFLFEGESVEAGQLLARMRSPEREAELAVMQLRREALEARKEMLNKQPLEPDPELIRILQEASADQRRIRTFLNQLGSETRLVTREFLTELLTKQEKKQQLDSNIVRLEHELEESRARLAHSQTRVKRMKKMAARNLATPAELDEQKTELAVFRAKVTGLSRELDRKRAEQALVSRDLEHLTALQESQAEDLESERNRTRSDLAGIGRDREILESELAADLARAAFIKERQLAAVAVELRQIDAQIAGLESTLNVKAPLAGTVAYRDPSPNAAEDATAVLVLAPSEGFVLRMRLPTSEVESLQKAGSIIAELLQPAVQRRFAAELERWRQLPEDPRFVLVDLRCQPPNQAIRDLASGTRVAARLVWRPPLYAVAAFPFAVILLSLGGLGLFLGANHFGSRLVLRRTAANAGALPKSAAQPAHPGAPPIEALSSPPPGASALEVGEHDAALRYGNVAAVLQMLAHQLREMVMDGGLDELLLAAIEWNVDRHHRRAIEVLREVLGTDEEFLHQGELTLADLVLQGDEGDAYQRLDRILRLLSPDGALERVPSVLKSVASPN